MTSIPCANFFAHNNVEALKLLVQEIEEKHKRGAGGSPCNSVSLQCDNNPANRLHGGRSYSVSRRGFRSNFVPPIKSNGNNAGNMSARNAGKCDDSLDDSTRKWLEVQPSYYSSNSSCYYLP